MTNKPFPTLRRTKEQIEKDNKEFSNCSHCGKPLRKSRQRRDSPKTCSQCRYELSSGSSAIRTICKQLQRKKPVIAEDEMMFEDSPEALTEDDFGTYKKKVPEVSFGSSPLNEIMESNNKYKYKRGSAKEGFRYKRS